MSVTVTRWDFQLRGRAKFYRKVGVSYGFMILEIWVRTEDGGFLAPAGEVDTGKSLAEMRQSASRASLGQECP